MVKNPPANAGDMGLITDLGRPHMPRSNCRKKWNLEKSVNSKEFKRSSKLGVCVMVVVLELYSIKEIAEEGEFVI